MSLVELQATVEGYRAEAGQLADEFTRVHAQVKDDPNLTPTGKRERLEPLHAELTEQMSALRAREKSAIKAEKEKLERRVFGLSPSASNDPAKVVSYRDAQARVRELEDGDDAAELYESAKRSGDNILATAVLERALVRGWSSIKDDFLERNTAARRDLDDLAALAKYGENSLFNVGYYMPPSLDIPHSAGMPSVQPPLHSRNEPRGVRPLPADFGTGGW